MRSQIATSKPDQGRGGYRYRPYAFTEQGIAMLSSVLNSPRAIEVNIAIMRTFVQLRKILADNALLRQKIESLEKKYDENFRKIFAVLEMMLAEDEKLKQKIGYLSEAKGNVKKKKAKARK